MSVSLTVKYSTNVAAGINLTSYSLKVEILSATNISKKVFIFQASTTPGDNDLFVCVADPVDLQEFPEDIPNLTQEIPYYRKDTVILVFRDVKTMEETKNLIAADLQKLVKDYAKLIQFTNDEIVTYTE